MTSDNDDASTLPRRQLGRFLRKARDEQGLSIARVAELVELSPAGLQRIESGKVKKVRVRDIQAICEVLEVSPTDTDRAVELAKQAQVKSWYTAFAGLYSDNFNMYVGLEASARRLVMYHEHIPGLLQISDYARAVFAAYPGFSDPEQIDRRVEHRLKRQTIITRKTDPLQLEVLLHESALHRVVGSQSVMAAQLRHLAEIGKRFNVSIRVHPYAAGLAWGMLHGPFVILDFGTDAKGKLVEPSLVFLESQMSNDLYLEKVDDVQRYHGLASAIRDLSMGEEESRDLLRQAARSFEA
ncbi:helix-turn-helix domain-containing protein [Nocardia sp. NBC_00881]|uniref:helix-turn-helix domain-containing protein n=1 Tax=Nocardia sp. NBC_00881 TaxID=2975995 RepID=UPI0038668BDC|nr:helix-turn-helix domain-containing protein [Nocardia sp. NBC_00881]